MTSSQEQQTLKRKVFHVIAFMSGYDDDYIKLDLDLKSDLGLYSYQRKALAAPFLRITRDYNPKAKIGRGQCEKLKTVKEAVDLVLKAASFEIKKEEKK